MTASSKLDWTRPLAALGLAILVACGGGGGGYSSGGNMGGGDNGIPPSFIAQPAAVTVTDGQTATFTATPAGTPTPTEQWERSLDGTTWSTISGATSASYTFSAAKTDQGAMYRARASNASGSATSSPAMLTVFWAPAFTAQPANQAVNSPAPAVFTMAMDCNPDASSQWQSSLDGISWQTIPGATGHTYDTGPTSPAMNNMLFRCVCTNQVGSSISNPATLLADVPASRTVRFVPGGGGTVTGTLVQNVPNGGSTSAVSALPDSGFTFLNWTGAGFATSTANPLVVPNVIQDLTLTANFSPIATTYTITASAGAYGQITPNGVVTVAA